MTLLPLAHGVAQRRDGGIEGSAGLANHVQFAWAFLAHARLQGRVAVLDAQPAAERAIERAAKIVRHRLAADQNEARAGRKTACPVGGGLCRVAQRRQCGDEGQGLCRRQHVDAAADQHLRLAAARDQRQRGLEFRREMGEISERGVVAAVAIDDGAAGFVVVAP